MRNNFWSAIFRGPEDERGGGEPAAPAALEGFDPEMFSDADVELPGLSGPAGEGGQPEAGAPQPGPDADRGTEATPPADQTPSPTPEPGEASKDKLDPRDQQLAELREKLANLEGRVQGREEGKPKEEAPQADPDGEEFKQMYGALRMPKPLVNALNSEDEDERAAALSGLMGAVLTRAQRDARAFVRRELQGLEGRVGNIAHSTIETRTTAQRLQDEFFSENPGYSPEGLRPIVGQTMQQVALELQAAGQAVGWTPEFKQAVVERLQRATGIPPAGFTAAAAPAPAPTPRKTFSTGGGSGPARGAPPPTNEFDIFPDT